MYRYFSSIFLLLFSIAIFAEEAVEVVENVETSETKVVPVASKDGVGADLILTDTIKTEKVGTITADSIMVINQTVNPDGKATVDLKQPVYQGTYINVDIYNPLATLWSNGRFEFCVSADVSLWHRLFPVVEFGMMFLNRNKDDYQYKTSGFCVKTGAVYNFLNTKKDRKKDHMLAVGVRYAYANVNYVTKNAHMEVGYFGEEAVKSSEKMVANVGYVEFIATCRVQIYKDLFMGLSGIVKTFPHSYAPCPIYPTYIPGFGEYTKDAVNFGVEYTITYRIPSMKLRKYRADMGL